MTLAAHERAFFLLLMTFLAIAVKGLQQSGFFAGRLQVVTIRATLVLG
jgi:hypothetical protein